MFSKLTLSLAVTMSLLLINSAQAQTKKANSKKATASAQAKTDSKADEAKAADAAAKKAADEKALEAKRAEEAKAAAEKAKLEDSAGVYGYIKSHFSASYHGEYYFQRRIDVYNDRVANGATPNEDDKKITDIKIMHNPTVIYRPFTNWKFLATSEFKYTDVPTFIQGADGKPTSNVSGAGSFINRHYRSLFLLTRENVLTEKEHGVKLDLGIGRRVFDRNHGKAGSYGNNRVNASLSKKFGDKLSTSMLVQYLANDPAKKKITANTWEHSLELIPSFTYQITDKLTYFFNDDFILNTAWQNDTEHNLDFSHEMNIGYISYQFTDKNSAYFQFKYLRVADNPFGKPTAVSDWFEYYIGDTYSFTPKLSLTAEVGSEIFRAHDGRDFFAQKVKYPEFALYLDYAL